MLNPDADSLRRRIFLGLAVAPLARRLQAATPVALSPDALELTNAAATSVDYRGHKAIHLVESPAVGQGGLAVLKGSEFRDGVIELSVAGAPATGASDTARGFIGVAFHVKSGASAFEYFYVRPTNGRSSDQVRRNHSVQYAAHPDYPWARLRKEAPERYESYVDLEPGVWTPMKIAVAGTSAKLFVHNAEQPTLIVDDLKLGSVTGGVALWLGQETDGYFTGLKITRA